MSRSIVRVGRTSKGYGAYFPATKTIVICGSSTVINTGGGKLSHIFCAILVL